MQNSKGNVCINTANSEILTIHTLLSNKNLIIPEYQRPYKWQDFHVLKLIDDLYTQSDKQTYRLGTMVLYDDANSKEVAIVDGQQRTITLLLILQAYSQSEKSKNNEMFKQAFIKIKPLLQKLKFKSTTSKANMQNNYQIVQQEVNKAEFSDSIIDFLLNRCEMVVITLTDISEAFQFFDSQNARGKDLSPHDLLKAFHLREFDSTERDLKKDTVKYWEDSNSNELAKLFAIYLYRIRGWMNGHSSRFFSKIDVDTFKGVNLSDSTSYPFLRALKITHRSVDDFNNLSISQIDNHYAEFPFSFDQTIINGRRFFEMVQHYQNFYFLERSDELTNRFDLSKDAINVLDAINSYKGKNRTGDKYTRSLFNALLMAYYDKFGGHDISKAISKIFIWAYYIRLAHQRLAFSSVDNHVIKHNLFVKLKQANNPKEFLHQPLPMIKNIKAKKVDKIQKLFDDMGYYNA